MEENFKIDIPKHQRFINYLKKDLANFSKLSTPQKTSIVTLLFFIAILPASTYTAMQGWKNSRAQQSTNFPSTPPISEPVTPPDLSTPTPTPLTLSLAARIQSNNSTIFAPSVIPKAVFTFEAWVKTDDFTNQQSAEDRIIFRQANSNNSTEASLRLYGHPTIHNGKSAFVKVLIYDALYTPKYINYSGTKFTTGFWHHVALVLDGTNILLYIDGELQGSQSYSGNIPFENPLGLNIGSSGFSQPLKGAIDEVRISNIARYSANFIPAPEFRLPDSNTVALFHLDGNVQDASDNHNHAQIIGEVQFVEGFFPSPSPTTTITPTVIPSVTSTPTITPTPATIIFTSIESEDGWLRESGENTNTAGTRNIDNKGIRIGDESSNSQYRGFLSFDTSALPDSAQILSAVLYLYKTGNNGGDPFASHGNLTLDIKSGTFNNPVLENADFAVAASISEAGIFNTVYDNQWSHAQLKQNALGSINKTGRTQVRLRFQLDDDNDRKSDYVIFASGEAEASLRPRLEVTWQ